MASCLKNSGLLTNKRKAKTSYISDYRFQKWNKELQAYVTKEIRHYVLTLAMGEVCQKGSDWSMKVLSQAGCLVPYAQPLLQLRMSSPLCILVHTHQPGIVWKNAVQYWDHYILNKHLPLLWYLFTSDIMI